MTLISVEHLSKSYQSHSLMGAGKPRCILDGISLTLNEGETVALLGRSGCGKSTLARQICGLEYPEKGDVFYRGKPVRKLDKKRLLNFAFSSGNIESVLSLYLNSQGNYNYYHLYGDIAYASWIEKDFIMEFYEKYPNIIKECLKIVRKELFNLNQEFFDRIKKIEISQRKIYYRETNKFKDSLKLLLAIFRLNLNDDKLTQLGLRKHTVKQLISLIKEIDRKIRVENNNKQLIEEFDKDKTSNLQFEKPIELSNMSNLAYATYLYLIGDNKADLISISESDDE